MKFCYVTVLPIFITKVILVNISFLSDEGMLGSKITLRKELLSLTKITNDTLIDYLVNEIMKKII